jgi:hypothetical protein
VICDCNVEGCGRIIGGSESGLAYGNSNGQRVGSTDGCKSCRLLTTSNENRTRRLNLPLSPATILASFKNPFVTLMSKSRTRWLLESAGSMALQKRCWHPKPKEPNGNRESEKVFSQQGAESVEKKVLFSSGTQL